MLLTSLGVSDAARAGCGRAANAKEIASASIKTRRGLMSDEDERAAEFIIICSKGF